MKTSSPHPNDRRFTASSILSLLIFLILYWLLACTVLWWAYDISTQVGSGYYRQGQALVVLAKIALIVAILTSAIWLLVDWQKGKRQGWRLGWNAAWKTWAALIAYVAVVLVRRQLWTPSQGMSDGAQFLPIVGYTNAQFLAEFRWLSFVIQVIPIVGLISGGLYLLRARMLRMWHPDGGAPTTRTTR